jgi:hypothetical protein
MIGDNMAKGYGKGNSYGGGKKAVGLGQNSYGKKSVVGVTSANLSPSGRKGEKWLSDPRGRG